MIEELISLFVKEWVVTDENAINQRGAIMEHRQYIF